jgi:hypothetical protein
MIAPSPEDPKAQKVYGKIGKQDSARCLERERDFFVEACMYRRQDVCMFETIDTFVGFSMVLAKCAAGVCRTHVMLSYNRC